MTGERLKTIIECSGLRTNKLANYGQITGKLKPHLTVGLVNKVWRVRPDPLKQRCKGSHLFSTLQAFQKF